MMNKLEATEGMLLTQKEEVTDRIYTKCVTGVTATWDNWKEITEEEYQTHLDLQNNDH